MKCKNIADAAFCQDATNFAQELTGHKIVWLDKFANFDARKDE